jgi:hypothetical protein
MPLNSDLTNRNRIRGRRGGVSGQRTATPDSHSDTHAGKSGGYRGKQLQLTLGDLSTCRTSRLPTWQRVGKGREKSAEAVVARTGEGPNLKMQGADWETRRGRNNDQRESEMAQPRLWQ